MLLSRAESPPDYCFAGHKASGEHSIVFRWSRQYVHIYQGLFDHFHRIRFKAAVGRHFRHFEVVGATDELRIPLQYARRYLNGFALIGAHVRDGREPSLFSPLVEPGTVYSGNLDHTSILQLIGDKFGKGFYSAPVYYRQPALSKLSSALTRNAPRTDAPEPPIVEAGQTSRP